MSHANGEVWTPDGKLVGFFEYDGTCDFACSTIWRTPEELADNWRKDSINRKCGCGPDGSTDVILYTDYANGSHWSAKACLKCMAVTDRFEPYGVRFNPFPAYGGGNDDQDDEAWTPADGHPFPNSPERVFHGDDEAIERMKGI
jgi:hypothetical protein